MKTGRNTGFTLIELLIVVAIISVLAAIAVPNFLDAQTRAKMSRVKSDMRSMSVGIESYAVDNNTYPYQENQYFFPHRLTTPVAYLTQAPLDTFRLQESGTPPVNYSDRSFMYYRFVDPPAAAKSAADSDFDMTKPPGLPNFTLWGPWVISSFGPDHDSDGITNGMNDLYDATNGTISNGDIGWSQKQIDLGR